MPPPLCRLVALEAHHRVAVALVLAGMTFKPHLAMAARAVGFIVAWDAFALCSLSLASAGTVFTDTQTRVREGAVAGFQPRHHLQRPLGRRLRMRAAFPPSSLPSFRVNSGSRAALSPFASRRQVFSAFAEPEHLTRWWGPNDFRSTIHEFAFRPGGRWQLTLHGPDGADYENEYFATEIVEPERIVISHPDPAHAFELIVTLVAAGENKTLLTWHQVFSSREHFEQVRSFVANANEQVLDRLEAEVATIS